MEWSDDDVEEEWRKATQKLLKYALRNASVAVGT
jgi:hypothetical protein